MELEHLTWTCESAREIPCPLCASHGHTPVVEEQGLTIVRCTSCGLAFVNPQPTAGELGRFYAQYFPPESTPLWARQMAQVFRREGRNRLLQFQRRGRLLDVGCGFGFFLKMMQDAGWDVTGIEPSSTASAWGRERLGLDVLTGTIEDADLPQESFDAVTLWYVLEHTPNPGEVLQRCADLLRPGGMLIARVPNNNVMIDAVLGRLGAFGERFFLINPPRHLFDYTVRTLTALMDGHGLRVRRVRNSIPRSTGTIPQLLRRSGWFLLAEALRVVVGKGHLFGSSMTLYAEKKN